MSYRIDKKDRWQAKWIFGDNTFLSSAENITQIEGAKWIWPRTYARVHMRRSFTVDAPSAARAHFLCDNIFDLYINKRLVCQEVKEFNGSVAAFLQPGENTIAVRSYQTADTGFFTSAFCGKIEIDCGEKTVSIVTDEHWKCYFTADFWSNEEPAEWMDGLCRENELKWCDIHPRLMKRSLYMRKNFLLEKPVKKAELCVSTAGEAELYINGRRTDQDILPQGICEKYKEFRRIEVTPLLRQGSNAIGAITGNGWLNSESHSEVFMNRNMLLAELTVTFEDGTQQILGTDQTWRLAFSPLTDNDIQLGERYDATLEQPGWNLPDFDDTAWACAAQEEPTIESRPYVERNYPGIQITKLLKPFSCTTLKDKVYLFDFGVNCGGRYRIVLRNTEKGQKIKINFCERLTPEGDFQTIVYGPVFYQADSFPGGKSAACLKNYDVYTCRGGLEEIYEPHFAFSGFRYLYVEGCTSKAQIGDIFLTVMHNAVKKTGEIESGYSPINQLSNIVERAFLSNLFNGPMDCPTREKNFWTGDTQIFIATACWYADCSQLLARWTDAGRKMCPNVYGWGDETYIVPWTLYRFYRDKEILRACYGEILSLARYRCETAGNYGLPENPLSPFNDHLSPYGHNLPPEFFASAFYCYMLKITAQIAEILEDFKTADEFHQKLQPAIDEFNRRYYITEEEDCSPHLQSALVFALAFGLAPAGKEKALAAKLNEAILACGHLDTGYGSTRYLMNVLCDYGYLDTAFMLLDRTDFPSWRYILNTGATTMTESWNGMASSDGSSSMNHFALGSVVGWMFEYLGGIRFERSSPGFRHIVLQPCFLPQIGSFRARYDSVSGPISVSWKFEGKKAIYCFETEQNVTLFLPDGVSRDFPAGKHQVTVDNI